MPRFLVLSLPLIVLILGVPWYFSGSSDTRLFGLPVWVVFSLAAALVFASTVAFLLGRCWDLSAGPDDEEDPS